MNINTALDNFVARNTPETNRYVAWQGTHCIWRRKLDDTGDAAQQARRLEMCPPGEDGDGGECDCTGVEGWSEGEWEEPECDDGSCFTRQDDERCEGKGWGLERGRLERGGVGGARVRRRKLLHSTG